MNLDKLAKDLWWGLTAFRTIDNLPDAVIYVDDKGYIKQFNKRAKEIFAFDYKEFADIRFEDFVKDGMDYIAESAGNNKPILVNAVTLQKEFYVELNAQKKRDGYFLTIRDLTALKNEIVNEEKTKIFNREKNVMLSKIESDIKSPLTSISGFSQGLLDGLGGELTDKQAKYIKIINNNAEELYHFMDKFLEFSKAESSIYEADWHNFDVVETFKSISKDFEPILAEKRLGFDIDDTKLEKRNIYSDFPSVKSAFKNILEAAISMTDSGYISVKLTSVDEEFALKYNLDSLKINSYIAIIIKDTGSGVSEDEMKYLCEPYAQLERGKNNLLRSFKLGIASILIKRANGFINIQSELLKGAKYTIVLPIEK